MFARKVEKKTDFWIYFIRKICLMFECDEQILKKEISQFHFNGSSISSKFIYKINIVSNL